MAEPFSVHGKSDSIKDVRAQMNAAVERLREEINAKDAEIARLTFQLSEANRVLEAHKVVAASRSENIAALKADKARLRGGYKSLLDFVEALPSMIVMDEKSLGHHAKMIDQHTLTLSPADAPLPECLCSYTIDGRLVKQCDNCRNKPFAPADGGGVEETQWISVKDRLPRINGSPDQMDRLTSDKVLAYAPERHPFTTYLRLDDRNEMGMRTEGKTHKWGLNEYNQNVTHWMPLPEPPTQGRGIEG